MTVTTDVFTTPRDWTQPYVVTEGDLDTYNSSNDYYLFRNGAQHGTVFPTSPTPIATNRWYHDTFKAWFVYNGSSWDQISVGSFTTMPASPIDGLRVWRTDLGREYQYYSTGTRWLSEPYVLPFNTFVAGAQPFATSPTVPLSAGLPPLNDMFVVDWRPMVYPGSPNTGAIYWTINLRLEQTSGVTVLASFNTSALTADTYTRSSNITSFATNPIPNTNAGQLTIEVVKTGSPGALYISNYLRVKDVGV
jgi:hypothetical protein